MPDPKEAIAQSASTLVWVLLASSALVVLGGCGLVSGSSNDEADGQASSASDSTDSDSTDSDSTDSGSTADGSSSQATGRPDEQPLVEFEAEFTSGTCIDTIPAAYQVECGTVDVPMNWETGDGTVSLAVAVFSAQPGAGSEGSDDNESADTAGDTSPVVYLEGGPGGHALEALQFTAPDLLDPLLPSRDVVVFDQRGAGLSQPRLACDEVTVTSRELEDIPVVSDEESERRFHDALAECRQRLQSDGVDLASFNTRFNARDVDAIRQALDYDRISLLGVSYGTKLGLEVLRRHPENVTAAVLDSVFPPEVDSVAENPQTFIDSYEKMTEACLAESGCRSNGDLAERLTDLVAKFQVDPALVTVEDWIDGSTDSVYLTGDTLVGIVTQSLYSPQSFSDLPELVDDLEQGRFDVVEEYLSQQRTTERFFTDGMFYAITCREEVSFADPEAVVDPPDPFGIRTEFDLASNVGSNAFATCEAFENGAAPSAANEPVESDVPTLLLAGAFDPVTPVEWAEDAAEDLGNATVVVAQHESHGVSSGRCGMSIITEFLASPEATPNTSCLADRQWGFIDTPQSSLELAEASFTSQGLTVTTTRPESWSVGVLEGDQYRRLSFLDPTQLHQLAGDERLGEALQQFIEESNEVELGPPEVFGQSSTVGPLRGSDLGQEWTRRSTVGSDVVVEWFERPVGQVTLYVILVAPAVERDSLVASVLEPALSSIEIESSG